MSEVERMRWIVSIPYKNKGVKLQQMNERFAVCGIVLYYIKRHKKFYKEFLINRFIK